MKKILLISALLLSTNVFAGRASEENAIARCLENWKTHPFSAKNPTFTTLKTTTKVLGMGSKSIIDSDKTSKPKLVLVKPGINVLTKNVYELLNPNGWYCLMTNVTVLGKVELKAHCDAHLASASNDVTILGANDNEGGTTVLGSLRIKRVDCSNS